MPLVSRLEKVSNHPQGYPHCAHFQRELKIDKVLPHSSLSDRMNSFFSSHFAPAFYVLSPKRREALKVLYAVCRILDDTVDHPTGDPLPQIAAWRSAIEGNKASLLAQFGHEELGDKFLDVIKTYDIPLFSILDLMSRGVLRDLDQHGFETAMDLEEYCYGVAGTVGIACLPIFGVPWQEAKDFAVRLGITVQWINTIRDVGDDAQRKRVYWSKDHLEKFGCSEKDILARKQTPEFLSLIQFEESVARQHYRRAMELLPHKWKAELLPARIMGEIYMRLLEKIRTEGYPVLDRRVKLNLFEKIWTTWKTWKN